MYRRWAYMAIAVLAAILMTAKAPFSFQEDKGIIYVRSFSMDLQTMVVTQTELETGVAQVTATMSVAGLYYCYWIMLFGSLACLIFMIHPKGRLVMCDITMIAAGVYYVLLVIYALRISDAQYATLAPTWAAFMPAVVLEMMILVHRNVLKYGHFLDETPEE